MTKRQSLGDICDDALDNPLCDDLSELGVTIPIPPATASPSVDATTSSSDDSITLDPATSQSTSTTTQVYTSISVVVIPPTLAPSPDATPTTVGEPLTTSLRTAGLHSSSQTASLLTDAVSSAPAAGVQTPTLSAQSESPFPQQPVTRPLPPVLVAGVATSVFILLLLGVVLCRFHLSRRRQSRQSGDDGAAADGYGEDVSPAEWMRRRFSQRPALPARTTSTSGPPPSYAWLQGPQPSPVWQNKPAPAPPSYREYLRTTATPASRNSSYTETDSVDLWPAPLSPRPAMQQTIHRVSVPQPVEASTLRRGSRSSSRHAGGSTRSPSIGSSRSTRKLLVKVPPPAMAQRPWPTTSPEPETPQFTLGKLPETGLFRLQPLSKSEPADLEAGPVAAVGAEDKSAAAVQDIRAAWAAGSAQRDMEYTVLRSPLAQNPFIRSFGDDETKAHPK